jgi:hypothetical protein
LFFVPTNLDAKSLDVDKKSRKLQLFIYVRNKIRMPCLKKLSRPYGVGKRFLVEQNLMTVDDFVLDLLKYPVFSRKLKHPDAFDQFSSGAHEPEDEVYTVNSQNRYPYCTNNAF